MLKLVKVSNEPWYARLRIMHNCNKIKTKDFTQTIQSMTVMPSVIRRNKEFR